MLCKWDILFGAMRRYFHKVCIAPFDGTTSHDVSFSVRHKQTISLSLLCSGTPRNDRFRDPYSTGSKIPYAVRTDSLNAMPVIAPPFRRAQGIHRALPATRPLRMPEAYVRESRTLAALRDTLLPKLISGELRMKDAERFIGKGA